MINYERIIYYFGNNNNGRIFAAGNLVGRITVCIQPRQVVYSNIYVLQKSSH